jgi:hypothetical protein
MPYRYAVYLHWMRQTAEIVGVWPAISELTLFQPPTDPMEEMDAADLTRSLSQDSQKRSTRWSLNVVRISKLASRPGSVATLPVTCGPLDHPDLTSVEIAWPTGLILSTRRRS